MMLNGGMGSSVSTFHSTNLASGLVISFRAQLFARLRHIQGRHFEMTQWIVRMFTTKFARY